MVFVLDDCGIDLRASGDSGSASTRQTYTFGGTTTTSDIIINHLNRGGGVFCYWSDYTYAFRQRVRVDLPYTNHDGSIQATEAQYQVWEYQYTHFSNDGQGEILPWSARASLDMMGYYVSTGLFFDSYEQVGQSDEPHLHLVIVVYVIVVYDDPENTDYLCTQMNSITYINPFTLSINE